MTKAAVTPSPPYQLWTGLKAYLLLFVAITCVLFFSLLLIGRCLSGFSAPQPIPFDGQLWQTYLADNGESPVRLQMVDDLLNRYDLNGYSKDELIELLGPPGEFRKDWPLLADWDVIYRLGAGHDRLLIYRNYLCFRFNEDGNVIDYEVVEYTAW